MKIPLRRLFPVTAFACEVLSMLALYLSPEVPRYLFYAPLALGVLALITKLRDRWLLPLIAAVVVGGIFAGFKINSTMAVIITLPMLAVHGLTWLALDQKRYRYWRIGLAFLEMILAAILSPEAHMFFLIFFFVIMVSITLSFGFLEQNFAQRDPSGLNRPLRPAYLAGVILLSFVIFLSSLAIFPILPRKENMDVNSLGAMPGYSEEVNFQTATFYWTGDASRAVMWLFQPKGLSWEEAIPFGLIRGKALERFNGRTWRSGVKRGSQLRIAGEPTWRMEILREPMPTETLLTPYGTRVLELTNEAQPLRYETGEWYQPSARGRRISYVAGVFRNAARDNVVEDSELKLPEEGFDRLISLGRSLQKNARSDKEKIDRVMQYFLNGNFNAQQVPMAAAADKGPSPIETFLFDTKTGHCELFATSAALLLRAMGLPTRLVVGFRAPKSSATVLTVRNGDAHAWVEVHTSSGWVVIDPTPAIPAGESRWQMASDFYDWVTAYWHRYILGYEFDFAKTLKWIAWAVGLGTGLITLSVLRRRWMKFLAQERGPRMNVAKVRISFQKKLNLSDGAFIQALESLEGGKDWWENYQNLRFGESLPGEESALALKKSARSLIKSFQELQSGRPSRQG